ncbi:hypothetical protein EVAR_4138_1 [Eumeta japonica]|uniref:Uncharacterized protein n=1 Tax=Eumeta variegata TaxID=151549 RepID=A0A4C1TJ88_EUMVA|nr:hypothetical protein EVAR_4138_1 [Eumeta japonica]
MWSTWLHHKNGPSKLVRYHILTVYTREVTASAVALRPRFVYVFIFFFVQTGTRLRSSASDTVSSAARVRGISTRRSLLGGWTWTQTEALLRFSDLTGCGDFYGARELMDGKQSGIELWR